MTTPTGRDFYATFLQYRGVPYRLGAEAKGDDLHPRALDCSEAVELVCRRLDIYIPDGAQAQYQWCKDHGTLISVDKAAHIRGALGFRINFHGGDHVVCSDGSGNGTMECKGRAYGCNTFTWKNRFNFAGLIPGLDYLTPPSAPKPPADQPPQIPFPTRRLVALGETSDLVGVLQFELAALTGANLNGEDRTKTYGTWTQFAVAQAAHWFAVVNGLHQFDGHNGIGVSPDLFGVIDLFFLAKTKMQPIPA